jgi:hypothetical protein
MTGLLSIGMLDVQTNLVKILGLDGVLIKKQEALNIKVKEEISVKKEDFVIYNTSTKHQVMPH